MYTESLIHPSRIETVARAPSLGDAMPTLGGHRDAPVSHSARFFLDVTAVSGTSPSMTMNVYAVVNNRAVFIGTFGAVTVVGTYTVRIDNVPDMICCAPSPLTGTTPSFTCEVRCVR